MGLITKGMGAVLKHIKKPGKAFEKAGDKGLRRLKNFRLPKRKVKELATQAYCRKRQSAAGTAGGYMRS